MTSPSKPDFLSRAKIVSENKQPDFLSRAKQVSFPEDQYVSDEQVQRDIERNQAQFISRGAEAIAGLPGDLANFVGGLFGYQPGYPGSGEFREASEEVSQGYTKPQNELEEKVGEVAQDVALFALPGAKHYSFARNLGIPLVANLAKEGIKYAGGDEKQQAGAKIGSMVLLDLLSHRKGLGTAKEYASSLFQKADEMIPKGLSISAENLQPALKNLESSFMKGGSRPDTAEALTKIKEILGEVKNGKIDLKDLVAFRPSINKWVDKYKGFEIGSSPAIRKQIINNLNKVKSEVINAAEEYGSKYNPEYLKMSQSANEAYAAVSQSNKISNFIEKHAGNKLQSMGAKALLGMGGIGSAGTLGGAAGAAIGSGATLSGIATYKLFKTILRSKSPTLRNHYFNIIKGAAAGNAGVVSKNAKALDKELKHMDETGEIAQFED